MRLEFNTLSWRDKMVKLNSRGHKAAKEFHTISTKFVRKYADANDKKVRILREILHADGQQSLKGKVFLGYDHDCDRQMIYRVDRYEHNNNHPMLDISELTVFPRTRVNPKINVDLHGIDLEVTSFNLKEVAEGLELSTEHFHWYV
jgi:hypothetical protein